MTKANRAIQAIVLATLAHPATGNDTAPVPKTGQTTSHASGDDGHHQAGVARPTPRFTVNDDGTVTDNLTGLIWLRNANCFGQHTWNAALTDANGLANGSCGLSDGSSAGDWRLPNTRELQSLIHYGQFYPALPNMAGSGQWAEGDPFLGVQSGWYWSGTTWMLISDRAWCTGTVSGERSPERKSYSRFVWPVRSGHGVSSAPAPTPRTGQTVSYAAGDDGHHQAGVAWPTPRFTDNDDGTVTDNLTGLVWLKSATCFPERLWEDALTDANSLASGSCGLSDGSSAGDWRLPNTSEFESLIHSGLLDPALPDTSGSAQWSEGDPFSSVPLYSFSWSSTTTAEYPYYAWAMRFGDGLVASIDKGYAFTVWPVRDGPRDGDVDHDGDVSLNDFGAFAGCLAGPGVSVPPEGCAMSDFTQADLDDDKDLDLRDLASFQRLFTGPR